MAIRSDSGEVEQRYLRDMLARDAGAVLEIGCGDGRLTRRIADGATRVIGIDLPAMLPREGAAPLPETASLAAASGVHLPFPAQRFTQAIFTLSF